jgi:hypothetical protein
MGENTGLTPTIIEIDPNLSLVRETVSIREIKCLGEDIVLPVPIGLDSGVFKNIVLDYLGHPEDLDKAEQIPILVDGPLSGYRFGHVEGYLSRVARILALIEQIKTGTFDDWENIEHELMEYLEFNNTKTEDTVVMDQDGYMVAACRIAYGRGNSRWCDFEMGHLYDFAEEDSSLAPIDLTLFSDLEGEIAYRNIGLGSIMEVSTIVIAEQHQNTPLGLQLLMAMDAAVGYACFDTDGFATKQYQLVIASTQKELTDILIRLFEFKPFGPSTSWGTTPMWVTADTLSKIYHSTMKLVLDPLIQHLHQQA